MTNTFLGLTMGLRSTEVQTMLRQGGVIATVRPIAPPVNLAFGLSRKRFLEKPSLPTPLFRKSLLALMGLWGLFGACLSFGVTAFFLGWSPGVQRMGLAASLATGALAVTGTAIAVHRVRKEGPDARLVDSDLADALGGVMWAGSGTEFDLIVICFLLVLVLFLFVLYVIWLPLLLGIVALLTFGQIWREFQGTLVVADVQQSRELVAAAEGLLSRGAVLSKSWDALLSDAVVRTSIRARASHYRVHRLFLAAGASSFAAAGLAFLHREFPSDMWSFPIAVAVGGAVLALAILTVMEHRRRPRTSGV